MPLAWRAVVTGAVPGVSCLWLSSEKLQLPASGRCVPHWKIHTQHMPDTYRNFVELNRKEVADRDFRVRLRRNKSDTVIIAPHGGGIEQGTSEIAEAIAAEDHSF